MVKQSIATFYVKISKLLIYRLCLFSFVAPKLSLVRFGKEGTEDGYDVYELFLNDHNSTGILNLKCRAEEEAVANFGECRQAELNKLHYKVLTTWARLLGRF